MSELDPVLAQIIGSCFLCWVTGFLFGVLARAVRQFFEKATRG